LKIFPQIFYQHTFPLISTAIHILFNHVFNTLLKLKSSIIRLICRNNYNIVTFFEERRFFSFYFVIFVLSFQHGIQQSVETAVEYYGKVLGKLFPFIGKTTYFPHILPMLKSQLFRIKQYGKLILFLHCTLCKSYFSTI